MLVLGDLVSLKAVAAIHILVHASKVVMASFTGIKNQIGSSMSWTGAVFHLMLGLAWIQTAKRLKAIAWMRQLW